MVSAASFDAHACAITIGEGAEMATLTNSGTIVASASRGFDGDGFADDRLGQWHRAGNLD